MEPVQQKSNIVSVINFIVVFISICLIVGAVFGYRYLKQEGYFRSDVVEEATSEPITPEQKEETIGALDSSMETDVTTMNNTLDNMSESDAKVSEADVEKALNSLE